MQLWEREDFAMYWHAEGTKKHNRLWNGGNGWGTIRLYDKKGDTLVLVDEIDAPHVGCEYGEYGFFLSYDYFRNEILKGWRN